MAAEAFVPRVLVLTGPTASGKTAAAMAIAQKYPLEIISVDSALVYLGMDIGTAKPGTADLARVRHHLIDIRDPLQAYSAAEFVRDATRLVGEINQRGRLALLVGGTMLYLKAWMYGLDAMPPADPVLRAAIEQEALRDGWPALHARLALVDPTTAARLAPADSQRIQRALEVYRSCGQPISSFQLRDARSTPPPGLTDAPVLSLEPVERRWLHGRIAERFDHMLAAGLLDEVKKLRSRGDLRADLPAMRCVGYRQVWEALESGHSVALLRERGLAATRQLAKRQMTWLRAMPGRQVVACDRPDALGQLLTCAERLLQERPWAS